MRRALLFAVPVLALALTGCPGKPKDGTCKTSEDCADQEGFGKVCVEGRCQECGQDTDCKAGFVCRGNKCVPRPECEKESDCPAGKTCEAGRCVAVAPRPECGADADCGPGQACENGKCVTRVAAAPPGCPADGKYEPIYFDFDKSLIRSGDAQTLEKDAACIKEQKPRRVVLAGHCDERGTAEYNLHLGQRRAESTKKYLQNLGIAAGTLKTVSYGKERPVCTEHDEACWARNRRAEITAE
ncbi:MAG TPA: peptidoglycan-associated lipoprotein Pal [Anaeromyxobacteraceae bacterium]|nr:peptidoglycan-associated lipoprotein Pal [Anaeromyxobacteraceae bacterium]